MSLRIVVDMNLSAEWVALSTEAAPPVLPEQIGALAVAVLG